MASSVMWFRRDLRLSDNPALLAAVAEGEVAPLFVVDPRLWGPAGAPRRAYLCRSLRALDAALGGALTIRRGDPVHEVVRAAMDAGAGSVHFAADHGPYGRRRDALVEAALAAAGVESAPSGSPYAIPPGTVTRGGGGPYRVFGAFFGAWAAKGWARPLPAPADVRWLALDGSGQVPPEPDLHGTRLLPAGEASALQRWRRFVASGLAGYAHDRDRPDRSGTSMMSTHLKFGEVHPRTLLADLAAADLPGAAAFRRELAWREFYADVLWHSPGGARASLLPRMARMRLDDGPEGGSRLASWKAGRTGYPFVDAGLRQLRAEGWMHNRVRMVVASFLIKDLHLDWTAGARFFMSLLSDGDLASNSHGWQWVAGTGTDAAPYFRVFNPVTQGRRYDPEGEYVRRYVPELRHLPGPAAHEPWRRPDGYALGYPRRIVDHDEERAESLRRLAEIR